MAVAMGTSQAGRPLVTLTLTGTVAMTPGRRTLEFGSFDDIMPDVERLLRGHSVVGAWSLAQICNHLATVMRRVADLPADTPRDPAVELPEGEKRKVLDSGRLPEGLPAPAFLVPEAGLDEHAEAERLCGAIAHYLASGGPVAPHRLFGPLTRDEWDFLQRAHCAHHLSFATSE